MIEVGIGVLFALLFVTAYLLVSKLRHKGETGEPRWRELGRHPSGGQKRIEAKPPRLFLKTGEMSEHHAKAKESRGQ